MSEEMSFGPNMATQLSQYSIIESRINPENELKQIAEYITGIRHETVIDEDGNFRPQLKKVSKPIMTEDGANSFMQCLRLRINKMVVMGNFNKDQYEEFISDTRKELTAMLVVNCYKWGVSKTLDDGGADDSALRPLIDDVMAFIEPFMSRLLDNEERKGLNKQFTSSEKHVISGAQEAAE